MVKKHKKEKVIVNKIILHVEGLKFKDKGVPQSRVRF